jgi:hypothetical protein
MKPGIVQMPDRDGLHESLPGFAGLTGHLVHSTLSA